MSGRMQVSGDPLGRFVHDHPARQKHDHVVLEMESGARITFNDPRRFGAMDLMPTDRAETHPLLAGLGPEPLGNDFHEAALHGRLPGPDDAGQGGAAGSAHRRRAGQHLCLRGAVPRRLCRRAARPGQIARGARRRPGADHPAGAGRGDRGGRIILARLSARRMANWAISSTASTSTGARASPAAAPDAAARFGASCNRGGRPSIARNAKDSLIRGRIVGKGSQLNGTTESDVHGL